MYTAALDVWGLWFCSLVKKVTSRPSQYIIISQPGLLNPTPSQIHLIEYAKTRIFHYVTNEKTVYAQLRYTA